jgi:hypothetical protein
MSFRHTFVTEFLYCHGKPEKLEAIAAALNEYGTPTWNGHDGMGYFYGVIKDSNSVDTANQREEIIGKVRDAGAEVAIVLESGCRPLTN